MTKLRNQTLNGKMFVDEQIYMYDHIYMLNGEIIPGHVIYSDGHEYHF